MFTSKPDTQGLPVGHLKLHHMLDTDDPTLVDIPELPPLMLDQSFFMPVSAIRSFFQTVTRVPFYRFPKTLGWPTMDVTLPTDQASWVPTAETLQQRARQMRGSASGLDGWAADELAILPIEVFQLVRSLVLEWGCRKIWPSTWCDVRQVHLPKESTEPLRPVQPKDLRPISIFSTWYRLLTGAFMSQDVVRNWIVQVLPAQAHGGVRGRWIATAFHEILARLDAGGCALGLDFAKCFDRVDPRLVIAHSDCTNGLRL